MLNWNLGYQSLVHLKNLKSTGEYIIHLVGSQLFGEEHCVMLAAITHIGGFDDITS